MSSKYKPGSSSNSIVNELRALSLCARSLYAYTLGGSDLPE